MTLDQQQPNTENPSRAEFVPTGDTAKEDRVSLNGVTFPDAMRALLATPPPENKRKRR